MTTDPSDPIGDRSAALGQPDLFQELPEGRLHMLLATLEQEVIRLAARGRVSTTVRELSALLAELGEAEEIRSRPPLPSGPALGEPSLNAALDANVGEQQQTS